MASDTEAQSPSRAESPSAETNSKKRKNSITEIAVDLALPEPPSKKAKRLLKKGKTLPPKANSDAGSDAEGEDGKEAEKKKAKKERSPWGVWIGNLRFTVNKKEMRDWLIDNSGGSITEDLITRVHIPSNKPEKKEKKEKREKRVGGRKDEGEESEDETDRRGFQNKGFAYVDFSTEAANIAAIALSETEWHGRKLLIKDSKSFEGRPAKVEPEPVDADAASKAASKPETPESTATKIFVGNLSFNTNEDELWAHFEKCGPIRWVKVATFEDTGKCKGYGWVNFQEHDAADWAVKGFVKIKETIETIEDFDDEPQENDETTPEDEEGKTQLVRKDKIRKWWVNMLNGRQLKIQLAEDDQTRYKKRFGKDRPKTGREDGVVRPQKRERHIQEGRVVDNDKLSGGNRRSWKERRDEDNVRDPLPPAPEQRQREERKQDVSMSYHDDIQVARLTGAAVKPMGKKVTFD